MQLGMIGLGRMGANMVRRLMRNGHEGVVYDLNPENVKGLAGEGATGAASIDEFVQKLTKPRAAWIMVPAGKPTDQTVLALSNLMEAGDIIVDGGNSYFKDDVRRSKELAKKGIHYVDVGTSGGVWGVDRTVSAPSTHTTFEAHEIRQRHNLFSPPCDIFGATYSVPGTIRLILSIG